MTDPDEQRRAQEAGRSLAALLVTLAVLAAIWAVVWWNVPRDLSRPVAARSSSPSGVADAIPLAPVSPSTAPASADAGSGTQVPVAAASADPRHTEPAAAREFSTPSFSDQGARIETALDCREEMRKLCGDIEPGGGQFRDCLARHRELMPAACQQSVEERIGRVARGEARVILSACQSDLRRWCPNIPVRGAPIIRCLREHAPELSRRCTEVLIDERVL